MSISRDSFVIRTQELIEKEREAELEETRALQENVPAKELQRRGVALIKLRISSTYTGLYGRTVLIFETYWPGKELPSHSFSPGDIAGVSPSQSDNDNEALGSGIVSRVTPSAISVAFEESHEAANFDDTIQYKLVKLANDVTFRRLKRVIKDLGSYRTGVASNLIDVLFGESELGPPFNVARDGENAFDKDTITLINPRLDASQCAAVRFALTQRELAIIHGPPGTGKTTTVVEIILQAIKQGLKILACAPSNVAVDNLIERLAAYKARVIRLGHPARLLGSIQKLSLDAVLRHSDEAQVTEGIRQDLDKAMVRLKKTTDRGEKQALRSEVRLMRKDLKKQEAVAITEVLKNASVVGATLTSATNDGPLKHLARDHFDLVVIDECSQAIEAACWIPMLRCRRVILAGDHHQLPPTIVSTEAAKGGLQLTLMERQLELHGDAAMRMLTMQYRMNAHIMKWASDEMYEGKLVAHPSVAGHLLSDLPGVSSTEDTETSLLLVDTAGCGMWELDVPDEVSKGNEGEVDLCVVHVEKLIKAGLEPCNIAVIAPYNLQVELLRLKLSQKYPLLEIKSVDGFQGREKEAVVISMVRSNAKRVVGFLAENRRINVAITRARRHLAVVCDSETVGSHDFLQRLIDYMSDNGQVRSAEQYIQEGDIDPTSKRPDFLQAKIDDSTARHKKGEAPKSGKKNKKQVQVQAEQRLEKSANFVQAQDKPKHVTKEEADEDEMRLKKIMTDFLLNDKDTEYSFPTTLDSRQRFTVHELAEKLGLCHVSTGEGKERHIIVSKRQECKKTAKTLVAKEESAGNRKEETKQIEIQHDEKTQGKMGKRKEKCSKVRQVPKNNLSGLDINDTSKDLTGCSSLTRSDTIKAREVAPDISKEMIDSTNGSTYTSNAKYTTCLNCTKEVPIDNIMLHELSCKSKKLHTDTVGAEANIGIPKPSSSKSKKKKEKGNKQSTKMDEDDFDSVIAAAMKENARCHVAKCKENVVTLGQKCSFCAQMFCIKHHMAEVHGCGAAAKTSARQMICREGILYRGSGVPDKKPDPVKRAHLQRKLDKKLNALGAERKSKTQEK